MWLLPGLMLLGGSAGVLLGSTLGANWQDPGLQTLVVALRLSGSVFLAMLKALVVPLIVTSICVGMRRLGAHGLSRMALSTVAYFMLTTAVAVLTGLLCVQLIHPGGAGSGLEIAAQPETARSALQAVSD
ncbi:MAG: cation:dicarboxylase symporter family transporter [Acidobacteria bacterium]|nr:cation:dicarboxylase symporter family transporter [Acidobacteriota bacterium]